MDILHVIFVRQISLINTSPIPLCSHFQKCELSQRSPLTSLTFTGSLFGALNYQESNSLASVEAEDFASQVLDSVKRWYVNHEANAGPAAQDRD